MIMNNNLKSLLILLMFNIPLVAAADKIDRTEKYIQWYAAQRTSGTEESYKTLNELKAKLDVFYKKFWGREDFFIIRDNVLFVSNLKEQWAAWNNLLNEAKAFINSQHSKMLKFDTTEELLKSNVYKLWGNLIERISSLDNKNINSRDYTLAVKSLDELLGDIIQKIPAAYKQINTSGYSTFKTTLRARELAGYLVQMLEKTVRHLQQKLVLIQQSLQQAADREEKKAQEQQSASDVDKQIEYVHTGYGKGFNLF